RLQRSWTTQSVQQGSEDSKDAVHARLWSRVDVADLEERQDNSSRRCSAPSANVSLAEAPAGVPRPQQPRGWRSREPSCGAADFWQPRRGACVAYSQLGWEIPVGSDNAGAYSDTRPPPYLLVAA
ncbi:hypothetical protein VOLCADRAFT_94659, partial [Volvox carteri f. nagariensis]